MIGFIALALVIIAWLAFAAALIFRARTPKAPEKKRERAAVLGIALQAVGFALVWNVRRDPRQPMIGSSVLLHVVLSVIAVAIAIVSVWLVVSAIRTLGRQWSFAARLVEDHQLVRSGVYARVRHPIYAGMLGMMIATGLTLSRPWSLAIAVVFGIAGTLIRVRLEEKLLRGIFPEAYDDYAHAVPALLPRVL